MVVLLNRQSKLDYFNSISSSKDAKPFWKQCKPYFSNKHAVGDSKIMLIENDKTILVNESISEKFSNYFSQIVDCLDLFEFSLDRAENTQARLTTLCQNSKLTLAL